MWLVFLLALRLEVYKCCRHGRSTIGDEPSHVIAEPGRALPYIEQQQPCRKRAEEAAALRTRSSRYVAGCVPSRAFSRRSNTINVGAWDVSATNLSLASPEMGKLVSSLEEAGDRSAHLACALCFVVAS